MLLLVVVGCCEFVNDLVRLVVELVVVVQVMVLCFVEDDLVGYVKLLVLLVQYQCLQQVWVEGYSQWLLIELLLGDQLLLMLVVLCKFGVSVELQCSFDCQLVGQVGVVCQVVQLMGNFGVQYLCYQKGYMFSQQVYYIVLVEILVGWVQVVFISDCVCVCSIIVVLVGVVSKVGFDDEVGLQVVGMEGSLQQLVLFIYIFKVVLGSYGFGVDDVLCSVCGELLLVQGDNVLVCLYYDLVGCEMILQLLLSWCEGYWYLICILVDIDVLLCKVDVVCVVVLLVLVEVFVEGGEVVILLFKL